MVGELPGGASAAAGAVSYTHLDVYKRQVVHCIKATDFAEGWKSHATLQRQSKDQFGNIIDEISEAIQMYSKNGFVYVPYTTKIWVSQLK